jgi:hypothetical protein
MYSWSAEAAELTAVSAPNISDHTRADFVVGEVFTYHITWLNISVGTLRAHVKDTGTFRGVPVYVIELYGETNRYASLIYRVRDYFVSYVDKVTLKPLKLEETRREGFYKKDAVTVFDHTRGKAYFHNYHDGSYKTYSLPAESYDIVSIFYRMRRASLQAEVECEYIVAFAEEIFHVWGSLSRAKLALADGSCVDAYYTEPRARIGDKIITDGTAAAFISSESHIPMRITIKAPLFTRINAVLCSPEEPTACA